MQTNRVSEGLVRNPIIEMNARRAKVTYTAMALAALLGFGAAATVTANDVGLGRVRAA
jgi:hypothetical protein